MERRDSTFLSYFCISSVCSAGKMEKETSKEKILLRASWVSTIGNAVLSLLKIAVGIAAGSLAVLGDGIDSATDVVISVVMIFTARLMTRPPSRKYAYGYGKAEGIATKILAMVVFVAGVQMLISSIEAIFSDVPREMPSRLAIYVTLFSIAGKLALAWHQFRQGRRINSPMLTANGRNMRNDVLISAGVLLGLFFTFVLEMPVLDAVTGFVISVFILKTGIEIFMDSTAELMDGVKDETIYNKIFEAVEVVPGVSNPHRVRSRLVNGMYEILLDIEADGEMTLCRAHELAEEVEREIKDRVDNVFDIFVHVEPKGKCHADERFGLDKNMVEK